MAGATDQLSFLTRLLLEIKALKIDSPKPTALDDAMGLVRGALSNPRTKNCIIIVDAINQFDDYRGNPAPIGWLPSKMSPNVRLFVSLTPQSSQFQSVKASGENWNFLQLQPLDREIKERMVKSHLARYNKRLDEVQMELLLSKESSDNPMWLSLATEELRVFGVFREVNNKITKIPDGLAELEAYILSRFEKESDGRRLIATLCFLECSVHGLLESELLELLATDDLLPPSLSDKIGPSKVFSFDGTEEENNIERTGGIFNADQQERLTASQWADIFRVLRPFMRPFGASGEGRLDFYHRSLSKAVRHRYLYRSVRASDGSMKMEQREDVIKWFHRRLADYFGDKNKNLERRVEEFPIHAWRCGDSNSLKEFLCNWEVFNLMYHADFARELSQSWEHIYFLTVESNNTKDQSIIYEPMENAYSTLLEHDMECLMSDEVLPEIERRQHIDRMEAICRVFAQNGRFDAAFELSDLLIGLAFPNVGECEGYVKFEAGYNGSAKFIDQNYFDYGKDLSKTDRANLAKLLHLKAAVIDEDMRHVDYMLASHIPKIMIILETFEKVIAILEQVSPSDPLLGKTYNRCSFYYTGIACRRGWKALSVAESKERAINRIEKAIEFYSSNGNNALNMADCYVTRGVCEINPTAKQQEYYVKGLNLVLENAGQFHPLLDRCYLNVLFRKFLTWYKRSIYFYFQVAIWYEETGDTNTAYDYFRKWYDLMKEMFGANHPRTHRAIRTLNEPTYYNIGKRRGDVIPQIGIQNEHLTATENVNNIEQAAVANSDSEYESD